MVSKKILIIATCCMIIALLILAQFFGSSAPNPLLPTLVDSPDGQYAASFGRFDKKIGPFTVKSTYRAAVYKKGPLMRVNELKSDEKSDAVTILSKQVSHGVFTREIPEQDLLPHVKDGQIEGAIRWSEDSQQVDFVVTDQPIRYAVDDPS